MTVSKDFFFGWNLFRRDRLRGSGARALLTLSLALGVAALVALQNFSNRIEATIRRDSKALLAADFQVQAWRDFDDSVRLATAEESARGDTVLQSDFVSALRFARSGGALDESITVSVRAIEGDAYPFYGVWKSDPQIAIKDLKASPEIVLDSSFRGRGFKVGDTVRLGKLDLKVRAFLEQEPQTVAGAFSLGPRVVLHLKWAEQTGLMVRGARVFRQLLIRSSLESEAFKKKFRNIAPDPHWRLITPEHANRQAERIMGRMRGFLSFVGLTALFLGGVGLFMIFRSQFLLRLPQFLTLRCLGVSKSALYAYALMNAVGVGALGWLGGVALGLGIESWLAHAAHGAFNMDLAAVNPAGPIVLGAALATITVLLAVLVPMGEILRVPVAQAIRDDETQSSGFSVRDGAWTLLVTVIVTALVGRDIKMSLMFLLGVALATLLLLGFGELFSRSFWQFARHRSLVVRHAAMGLVRRRSRSQLLVVCLGLSLFLLESVLMIGSSLRSQLNVAGRLGVPNIFLIGISDANREQIKSLVSDVTTVPITQSRLVELDGKAIAQDSSVAEDEAERFYQTREYFITRRSGIEEGERLLQGVSAFGDPKEGVVRASLEEHFADQVGLKVGSPFKLEIAGVTLSAEVRSLRKVDWFNLKPNFYIVVCDDDIRDAPMDYVGFARVPVEQIPEVQNKVSRALPQVTVLDGESIARRLLTLLNQLSFSVLAMSVFTMGSCFFVFVGMILSRRSELLKDIALWKCLGLREKNLQRILVGETFLTACIGSLAASVASLLVVSALCKFALDIPFEVPPIALFFVALGFAPTMAGIGVSVLMRSWIRQPAAELIREVGS